MTNEELSLAEIAGLVNADRAFMYTDLCGNITTWTGDFVATPLYPMRVDSRSKCVVWKVRDVHGQVWQCRHWPSAGDYVRMRKLTLKF